MMPRQQINLYTAELHPRQQRLNLNRSAAIWGLALALGASLSLAQHIAENRAADRLATTEAALKQAQAAIDQAKTELALRKPSPALVAQTRQLEAEAQAKDALLLALEQGAPLLRQGFSPALAGLARHPLEGLWLTHIEIVGADLNLSGMARDAELVPRYVETLGTDASLGRGVYQSLKMTGAAQAPGLLQFELRARRSAGARP